MPRPPLVLLAGFAALAFGLPAAAQTPFNQTAPAPMPPPAPTPSAARTMETELRSGTVTDVQAGLRAAPQAAVRLFGIPVQINAPVDPPYAGTAYLDLGGQPERGADPILAQGEAQ